MDGSFHLEQKFISGISWFSKIEVSSLNLTTLVIWGHSGTKIIWIHVQKGDASQLYLSNV